MCPPKWAFSKAESWPIRFMIPCDFWRHYRPACRPSHDGRKRSTGAWPICTLYVRAELQALAVGSGVHPHSILAGTAQLPRAAIAAQIHAGRPLARNAAPCWPGVNGSVLAPVAQVRHPTDGLAHLLISLPGQIGGFAGINSAGLTVACATRQHSLAPGQLPMTMLAGLLLSQAGDIKAAVAFLRQGSLAAGWKIYLDHPHSCRPGAN